MYFRKEDSEDQKKTHKSLTLEYVNHVNNRIEKLREYSERYVIII